MAGKASVGADRIMKAAVGAAQLKTISVGTTEVWSSVETFTEEWSTLDLSVWSEAEDPGGQSGKKLYVSGGVLNAPDITSWNKANRAWVRTDKKYLTSYGRWAVKFAGGTSSSLATILVLSSDSMVGEVLALLLYSNQTRLVYRGNAGQSWSSLAQWSSGYSQYGWVIAERSEESVYRVSFNGGSTWPATYRDTDQRGERARMGHIGVGIESAASLFGIRSWGGPVDRFRYTNDPSFNITS